MTRRKFRKTGRKVTDPRELKAIHAAVDLGTKGGKAKRLKNGNLNLTAARPANRIAMKARTLRGRNQMTLLSESKRP
jgi:hypothetical protein